MTKIRIKNWESFQHYKSKNGEKPLWLKLYRSILDDFEFHSMPVESRAILPMLWLIAGDDEGNLPEIEKISFRLRLSSKEVGEAIKPLIENGFIEYIDKLDLFYTNSIPEHIERTYREEQKERTEQKEDLLSENEKKTLTWGDSELLPEELFEMIWIDYPDNKPKGNKSKAKEKFLKLIKQGEDHDLIVDGVRSYNEFCKTTEQYNQHCITWLNQRGWEGEWKSGGSHHNKKTGYLDKIKNAGSRASQIMQENMDADRDAPWNQVDNDQQGGNSRRIPQGILPKPD